MCIASNPTHTGQDILNESNGQDEATEWRLCRAMFNMGILVSDMHILPLSEELDTATHCHIQQTSGCPPQRRG
jgi:hypothetical protein